MLLSPSRPWFSFGFAIFLLILTGWVDFLSEFELNFFIFYYVPIILTAWCTGRITAIILALLSTICWFVVDWLSGYHYSSTIYLIWNGCIRGLAFLVVAEAFSAVRREWMKERELSNELARALEKVKQLSGLLPICCSCKNIRNDQGYWQQIEYYISNHSEAEFTHGICPDCAKKILGELRDKQRPAPKEP